MPSINEATCIQLKRQLAQLLWIVSEEMPPNMPKPKGKSVIVSCFVDANHA
jgi:hypothetical protein